MSCSLMHPLPKWRVAFGKAIPAWFGLNTVDVESIVSKYDFFSRPLCWNITNKVTFSGTETTEFLLSSSDIQISSDYSFCNGLNGSYGTSTSCCFSLSINWQAPAAVTWMGTVTDDLYTVTNVREDLPDSGLKCVSQHLFIPWSYCPHYCCV